MNSVMIIFFGAIILVNIYSILKPLEVVETSPTLTKILGLPEDRKPGVKFVRMWVVFHGLSIAFMGMCLIFMGLGLLKF